MKIYIAGPFFNEKEKLDLKEMIQYVRDLYPEAELFIPMEHFVPGGNVKINQKNSYRMNNEIWGKKVFELDLKGIGECDLMFVLYYGHYSDTGTAWEVGYAFAKNIPIHIYIPKKLKSNKRIITSLMVHNSATKIITHNTLEQK